MTIRLAVARNSGPLLLLAIFAGMAAWSWGVLGDPFVDSARDLYAAQQIVGGRAIYSDLCYLFGPLPPGILAIPFSIFGSSVAVEKSFNLILLAVVVVGLYRFLTALGDRFSATVACAVFIAMFGLGQFTPLRNYNFLTPYTNAASWGFILGLCVVWGLSRFLQSGRQGWLGAAGAATGLAFLTKPEMFLAAALTLSIGIAVAGFARRARPGQFALNFLAAACGAVVALFLVLAIFSIKTPWRELWRGTTAGYWMALDPRIHQMKFFADVLGTRNSKSSYRFLLDKFSFYGQLMLPMFLLAMMLRNKLGNRWWAAAIVCALTGWIVLTFPAPESWTDAGRGIPLACAIVVLLLGIDLIRARRRGLDQINPAVRLIFALFALAMLLRTILNTRLYQYGFSITAAAMMLIVIVLLSWVPDLINRLGRSGELFRFAALGAILGIAMVHLKIASAIRSLQTVPLPGGYVSSGSSGQMLRAAMADLQARARPTDTLAALPEACWANFVTGIPNPTPYELLDPVGFIRAGGETPVLAAYQANPPTWIMLVHNDTTLYGASLFGIDFAQNLKRWIDENYELVQLYGNPPLQARALFGIALLKRRADLPLSIVQPN